MICFVAHLIPHFTVRQGPRLTNILSYLEQRISLSLIKHASDKILVCNTELKRQLVSMGFRDSRIVIDAMGIDKQAIDRAQPISDMSFDACFVGRLHITKGIFDLIEIWKRVNRSRPGARLAILYGQVSNGILEQISQRLKDYNLKDTVYNPGIVPSDVVYSVMKSSKVFVFPSHEEGWGIAICEAMATGLPVVAYDLPPYREFFTEGLVTVKLGDYESFAHAILRLLSDENYRLEMGKKAVRIATQYTWDATAERELVEIKGDVKRNKL
jgi:glycosyltransferase involved in cell wall biosynthesis